MYNSDLAGSLDTWDTVKYGHFVTLELTPFSTGNFKHFFTTFILVDCRDSMKNKEYIVEGSEFKRSMLNGDVAKFSFQPIIFLLLFLPYYYTYTNNDCPL